MPDYEGVFRDKLGPTLGSDAPGTGPWSKDTPTARGPGSGYGRGTPAIPTAAPANTPSLGYGGGGEGITGQSTRYDEPGLPEHGGPTIADHIDAILRKSPPGPPIPDYNRLYDVFRSQDGWRYAADGMASGSFTSPANGNSVISTTVTIANNLPPMRLSQFPGAIHLALFVREFAAMVTVTTMTGVLDWFFTDREGMSSAPLGMTAANGAASGLIGVGALMLAPYVDPTNTTLGTLTLNAVNIATTAGSIVWRLGFSYCYVLPLPAFKGYVPLPLDHYRDEGTATPLSEVAVVSRR